MEEKENFYRFCALLLDVGAIVLRKVFTFHHLGANTLAAYLSSNRSRLINLPVNIMRQEQLNTLFPPSGKSALIEEFDITLVCVLFRNLDSSTPSNNSVWSNPVVTDYSFQADVGRIRVIRNSLFGHVASASLDTLTFNTEASNLTTIYHRLVSPLPASQFSATDLQQMIEKELKGPLQPNIENEIKRMTGKLEEWQRYDEDVQQKLNVIMTNTQEIKEIMRKKVTEPKTFIDKTEQKRIIDLSQKVLEEHRSDAEKYFVETHAYRAANEILRQYRRLIITGKSGQGKSYMANQLLNKIVADDPNIKPLILSTVEEWKTLIDSSITLGIIVDDMCGRVCVNEELTKWRKESTYMQALMENGKNVVIFTMKSHLCEKILSVIQSKSNTPRALISKDMILNLDNISLKSEEKTEFANTYLKEFGLNDAEVSHLCEMRDVPVGFPQLCRCAEIIKEKSRLFDLFSKPREMILEQMHHFCQDDGMTYGCLVLVMLSRGKLNLQSIREFGDNIEKKENKVISVFRSCGIPDVTPIKVLKTLRSLQSAYLSFDATDESYSFDHDSIEEAVFNSYGELFPNETLLYCPLELICKCCAIRYESKAPKTTVQDNTLIVQPFYQANIVNRFITELRGGNTKDFAIISEANIWSCEDFRKVFFAECKEIHFLADRDENSLLVHAANANNRDLVDGLLHELDHIPEDKKKRVAQFLTKSAKASCAHKDTYLLEKICENGCVNVNDILPSSIQHGSADAILFLLESGADVNYRSENGENLLHSACLHGSLDIVKLLHSRNANLINEFDNDNRSVGQYTALGGNVEILVFLLPRGLNPLYTDPTGWNLLHYACWQGKMAMADHLMDKYPRDAAAQSMH